MQNVPNFDIFRHVFKILSTTSDLTRWWRRWEQKRKGYRASSTTVYRSEAETRIWILRRQHGRV